MVKSMYSIDDLHGVRVLHQTLLGNFRFRAGLKNSNGRGHGYLAKFVP